MKKKNLIVFGAGGHAVSCIDLILNQGKFNTDFGFNKIKIPITINKKFSDKYLKKIGFKSKISDDGNRYLSKGEYILKVDNQHLKFSVK